MKVAWRVLRTEGPLAFRDRTLDRLAEARRRRSFSPAPPGWRPSAPIPVLDLCATPPAPRLGGVQAQLLRRMEVEAERRPVALLYPEAGGWRLEVQEGSERRSLDLPGSPPSPIALEDRDFEGAVRMAAGLLGARTVYVDGLAGLPPGSLLRLRREGLGLVLSLHDFAPFCPRPQLLERPRLRFCWYSTDLARCGRCLRHDWPVEDRFQEERRGIAAELLAASELVFNSEFLRQTCSELFPGLDPERQRIVAPETRASAPLPPRQPGPVRHVALVGGVQAHKGALVFEEVVTALAGEDLRWTAYGGGDPELVARLRRLVRVRGYYRSGTLPRLLRRDGVDLALILSIWPETYCLVLDECAAAGVPVVAFHLGAVPERLTGGRLVPLEAGAEGIVQEVRMLK